MVTARARRAGREVVGEREGGERERRSESTRARFRGEKLQTVIMAVCNLAARAANAGLPESGGRA